MSHRATSYWESPSVICDGCGERLWAYQDEVVLTYVLNERAEPVLDSPRHYHPRCLAAAASASDQEN
ncbi:hypothetical protein [Nocardia asiatica]